MPSLARPHKCASLSSTSHWPWVEEKKNVGTSMHLNAASFYFFSICAFWCQGRKLCKHSKSRKNASKMFSSLLQRTFVMFLFLLCFWLYSQSVRKSEIFYFLHSLSYAQPAMTKESLFFQKIKTENKVSFSFSFGWSVFSITLFKTFRRHAIRFDLIPSDSTPFPRILHRWTHFWLVPSCFLCR